MITTKEKATVGLFVVTVTALTLAILGALWGWNATKPHKDYFVLFDESVAGLVPGSSVKYKGLDVGKVHDIRIDDSSPALIRVEIRINMDTPVKIDTKAQLVGQGLTGVRYLELFHGDLKETRDRDPTTPIPALPSAWTDAVERLTKISEAVTKLLDDQNRAEISRALHNVNVFLETGTATVVSSQATLERVSARLEKLLDEQRAPLGQLVDNLGQAAKDARTAIASIDATAKEVRSNIQQANLPGAVADVRSSVNAVSKLGPRVEDDLERTGRLIDELRRTTQNLDELTRELHDRPSLLLRDYERPRRSIPDRE